MLFHMQIYTTSTYLSLSAAAVSFSDMLIVLDLFFITWTKNNIFLKIYWYVSLQILESKLEATERNRAELIQKTKEKAEEHLNKVEKATQDLEVHQEASRVAAECALAAKLAKVTSVRTTDAERVPVRTAYFCVSDFTEVASAFCGRVRQFVENLSFHVCLKRQCHKIFNNLTEGKERPAKTKLFPAKLCAV